MNRSIIAASVLSLTSAAVLAQAAERQPGLVLRVYDIGTEVSAIPDLAAGQLPNIARVIDQLDLGDGGFGPLTDRLVSEVTGYVTFPAAGEFGLRLSSDDGSRLWLDGKLRIDHDGPHGDTPKDATGTFEARPYRLEIRHYEGGGGEALRFWWKPPGAGDFVPVPASALSHDADEAVDTAPGIKKIIPPLRRGLAGDGAPVAGMNPGFEERITADANIATERAALAREPLRKIAAAPAAPLGSGSVMLRAAPATSSRPAAIVATEGGKERVLAWLPSTLSISRPVLPTRLRGTTWDGHLLVADAESGAIARVWVDMPEELPQATVLRFARTDLEEVDAIVSDASGGFVLGNAKSDAGRLAFYGAAEAPAFEMSTVRAMTNGLEISFTRALDERVGWEPDSYRVEQWPFDEAGERAPRRDGSTLPVKSASVSADRRSVFLEIDALRTPAVTYVRLLPPCVSADGARPWSTEAWITLHALPTSRVGVVRTPPAQPPQNRLSAEEQAEGFRLLFDGKTTDGWRGFKKDGMPGGWEAIDGCLVRTGSGGDIITEEQFDNFELRLEWRISASGNSGIFYHVLEEGSYVWQTGPEMQVLDNSEHVDGRNPKTSAGSNYAMHAPTRDVTRPVGFFNEARLIVNGPHVEHWLNGEKIVEYELWDAKWEEMVKASKFASMPRYGREKTGHIALQDHGDRVWYRNIRIRPLSGR